MDGHFVPNITIGVPVVRALKRVATRPLDVHLMIEDRTATSSVRRRPGATCVGPRRGGAAPASHDHAHPETGPGGRRAEPVYARRLLEDIASDLDFVLVMSVNPGFGGQAFIPHSLEKLGRCAASSTLRLDGSH
jgi:ribulose-phosphate 3-epimerase